MRVKWRYIIAALVVAVGVPGGYFAWWLGSPLLFDETVDEAFPFAVNAELPEGTSLEQAEQEFADAAAIDNPVNEDMPDMSGPAPEPTPGLDGEPEPELERPDLAETVTPIPEIASPSPETQAVAVALSTGQFTDADRFHKGSGTATVYRGPDGSLLLRLEDFTVTNGPDLHVYVTPHENPTSSGEVKADGYLDLGGLKGNVGNQNYFLPDDFDIKLLGAVVIYCQPFNVIFSVAPLDDV